MPSLLLRRLLTSTFCVSSLALSLSNAPAAMACGGFFCSLQQPVDQAAERILFAKDGEYMVAHVQIQYTGPSENFSWIVPVPTPPELGVGSDALFQSLRNTTRPQFNIDVTTEGECRSRFGFFDGTPLSARSTASPSAGADAEAGVNIISQEKVGPFETVVLQGDDPSTVKKWLTENGYDVPPNVDPLLNPYIEAKMPLLALKLQKGRSDGDLQPITMRYKADKPMIPIQLTAVAATDDMDVQVWLLGDQRAIPTNYPHVKINEARVDWFNRGQNYRNLVTEAMNEAGGQGFVTEYAGASQTVDLSQVLLNGFNPENLRPLRNPMAFANAAQDLFNRVAPDANQARYLSFIGRHIPKPQEAQGISDEDFYGNLERYAEVFEREEVTVNTASAIAELQETFVKPAQDIEVLFKQHPYLTALYTTLSPEEMTKDPTFDYRQMEAVSAQRTATGIRRCNGGVYFEEAPIDITTPSGLKYTFQPPTENAPNLSNNPTQLPAAAVIQTLSVNQDPVTLRDETQRLNRALTPGKNLGVDNNGNTVRTAAGCACHSPNTPVPLSAGAGEGASYAMMLLGFLGWRKWKQNRR